MPSTARLCIAIAIVLTGCRSLGPSDSAPSLGNMPFPVDQVRTQIVAAGGSLSSPSTVANTRMRG